MMRTILKIDFAENGISALDGFDLTAKNCDFENIFLLTDLFFKSVFILVRGKNEK